MQPYFFPYIGYFQLINSVDRFIFFDDVQYIRHGWINRNRILKPDEGTQYFAGSLQKHSQKTIIKDIRLQEDDVWKTKIFGQLDHYKKRAEFYTQTIGLLKECLNTKETSITRFNGHCLRVVFEFLGIPFKVEISSEMDFDYSKVTGPGEWALRICEQLKADEYTNPLGGKELFNRNQFEGANIKLSFLSSVLTPYSQKRQNFEEGLSIIDVLMFNGPEETRKMVDKFEVIKGE